MRPERYERSAHRAIGHNLVVVCFEEEEQDAGNQQDIPFLSDDEYSALTRPSQEGYSLVVPRCSGKP